MHNSNRFVETIINTLRPGQNGRHFTDDSFKCIFLNENVWISLKISLKFVPNGSINKIPSLVWIIAWRRPGDKPLSEPMMVSLPTNIWVTRPQWVNSLWNLLLVLWVASTWIWWPSYIICRHRTGSSLTQVMACGLMDELTWFPIT